LNVANLPIAQPEAKVKETNNPARVKTKSSMVDNGQLSLFGEQDNDAN
jgi:hypothetical protein